MASGSGEKSPDAFQDEDKPGVLAGQTVYRLCCLAESSEWRGSVNCQNVLGHVRTVRPNKNPCSWLGVCRKCAESSLDCFAFLGRGAVATGGAVATVTKQCAHLARMCSL